MAGRYSPSNSVVKNFFEKRFDSGLRAAKFSGMKEKFIKLYAANMAAHSDKNPGLYVIPPLGWEELATRMTDGLLAGRAHLSDMAKKTAKQLGGKPTLAGIKALLIEVAPALETFPDGSSIETDPTTGNRTVIGQQAHTEYFKRLAAERAAA